MRTAANVCFANSGLTGVSDGTGQAFLKGRALNQKRRAAVRMRMSFSLVFILSGVTMVVLGCRLSVRLDES